MKIFGPLYDKVMQWSRHRLAIYWLSFVSFIEAIFFPIPPDVMLMPMSISHPQRAMKYALFTTVASVLGGIVGYLVGLYAFDFISSYISAHGYQGRLDQVIKWFDDWGIIVLFIAGFSPVPYKIFTVAAGLLQMAFLPFVVTAFISRATRFFLVAKLAAWGGPRIETQLRKFIEIIGWSVVALAAIIYFVIQ